MAIFNKIFNKVDGKELYDKSQTLFENGDINAGYDILIKAAEAGYAEAQYQLGCSIIEMKYNRPVDEGFMWMTKAAEQDHIFALNNLAMCYQMGEGVDVDYAKALELLTKAANLGDMMAYYNIGQAYVFGFGVKKDILKGLSFVQKVAESNIEGCEHAQHFLGQVSEYGMEEEGLAPNIEKAIEWYKKAAEHNDKEAIKALQRLNVIDGSFNEEEIAKRFMGMWLHYDMSDAEEILGKNLLYSAFYAPKNKNYNVLTFKDKDYNFFIEEMQDSLQTILNNGFNLRCRLRKEDKFYCDTIQNGQMVSYELFINENKIYRINKMVIEG